MKKRIACLAVPLAVDRLSALLTRSSMNSFEALNKPPLSPSGWLFMGVWTILFALMGTTSYLVVSEKPSRTTLNVYGAQLLFNFVWSLLFSTWHNTCLPLTDS